MKLHARKILIKNMVCDRCIFAVQQIFNQLNIPTAEIVLGEVITENDLSIEESKSIEKELLKLGFELITTRGSKLIEDIKKSILQYLEIETKVQKDSLSTFITSKLPYDYSYLSDFFSNTEGKTIEQFFINQRIEKVKALILFRQLTFTEIAFQTGFSSVHHLSAQFKKVTEMTPSTFKKSKNSTRKTRDSI
ncbi:helix-turn-helix domain-containing protein [Flavobacterium tegetincola]|uniref:helix-turn-helix domain-containing protein n=1 Tax=Flavobacterium tegetincola TaxID=150172 RepID=UPI000400DFF1|nr:AraC family transcriptional regulator [Flavobacterium tegetincola]